MKKGEHPVIFEYHTLNPFIDYVVICSAPSLRQVYAIADNVADRVKEHGYTVRSMEGDKDSSWVLVDLDSIVVHVFQTEERAHFQLENYMRICLVRTFPYDVWNIGTIL